MKTIIEYLKTRFPTMNDLDRQHLESLIKDLVAKTQRDSYQEGWERGLKEGRKLESAMWRGFAPDDLVELIKRGDE